MAYFDKYLNTKQTNTVSSTALKLKLRRAYYCSGKVEHKGVNSDGTYKILEGWVVIGFLGPENSTYIIPRTYEGLPIIGIHYFAYETLDGYNDATYEGAYKLSKMKIKVCFHEDFLLFVFPPRRYSNRRRIEVDYVVTYEKFLAATNYKNQAGMYVSSYFCYNANDERLMLSKLIDYTNCPFDYGYVFRGEWKEGFVYTVEGPNAKKENWNLSITLGQSCEKTYESSHPRGWTLYDDKTWPNPNFFTLYSWDLLQVGKYFRVPSKVPLNVEQMFKDADSVLCFMHMQTSGNRDFVFNTIKGSDVIIYADTTFPPVEGYR